MVNSDRPIEVYCTRPDCADPINFISPERLFTNGFIRQRTCSHCQMPLILEGRFLPIDLIGEGGFGRTFKARDWKFQNQPQYVVVKQLCPKNSLGGSKFKPSVLERIEKLFQREGEVLYNLHHQQIPRAYAFPIVEAPPNRQNQSFESNSEQMFFYLVQEYIEGNNLFQELEESGQFSGRDIIEFLQQMLPILKYIHNQGVIHRDIKPSNIMRRSIDGRIFLIDFGAVKQVVQTGQPVEQSTFAPISPQYAPPEQLAHKAISPSSDLYSLAATCVYLLTGKSGTELRHRDRWNWRQYARVNSNLAGVLDRMLSELPPDRYQLAEDVIMALPSFGQIESPLRTTDDYSIKPLNFLDKIRRFIQVILYKVKRRFSGWKGLIILTFLALTVIFVIYNWLKQPPICISDNQFSCGQKRLISLSQSVNQDGFKKGSNAFEKRDYQTAIEGFKQQLQDYRIDPETRIYLNNAKAAKNGNFIKIAVCIPIVGQNQPNSNDNIAKQILYGVAVVQEKINNENNADQRIKGNMLFIQICDDDNEDAQAENVARQIVQDKSILGVIGHYTSNTTLAAGNIYGNTFTLAENRLVAISPTSTAVRDSNYPLNKYVFRISPDTSVAAKKIIDDYILRSKATIKKVTIIYNDAQSNKDYYGLSLRNEFTKIAKEKQIKTVDCNLADKGNNVAKCMRKTDNDTEAILLAIDNQTIENNYYDIFNNRRNMILLAGNAVYSAKGLGADLTNKLIIAVQWIRSENNNLFLVEKDVDSLFARTSNGHLGINFRTAMAYNAAEVITQAMRSIASDINRKNLYMELKTDEFSAEGTNNVKIKFDEKGDRQFDASFDASDQLMFLVTPSSTSINGSSDGDFQFAEFKWSTKK